MYALQFHTVETAAVQAMLCARKVKLYTWCAGNRTTHVPGLKQAQTVGKGTLAQNKQTKTRKTKVSQPFEPRGECAEQESPAVNSATSVDVNAAAVALNKQNCECAHRADVVTAYSHISSTRALTEQQLRV